MKQIVLASSNAGKIAEFNQFFADYELTFVSQSMLGIEDAEENGLTFVENALIKARHATKLSGKPALADDSGLFVHGLGGAPGVYSARYAGVHGDSPANNKKLLEQLSGSEERKACFVCAIVYLEHENDPLPIIATGLWHGNILQQPVGNNGFGYDPIFQPQGHSRSAAEMSAEEKNAISHRARALKEFFQQYAQRFA